MLTSCIITARRNAIFFAKKGKTREFLNRRHCQCISITQLVCGYPSRAKKHQRVFHDKGSLNRLCMNLLHEHVISTTAPIGAWKCDLWTYRPFFIGIMNDRPTHSFTSNYAVNGRCQTDKCFEYGRTDRRTDKEICKENKECGNHSIFLTANHKRKK